jgi:large subunit ribosomal protein L23
MNHVVSHPILTEKSALNMEKGLYVFAVLPAATKTSVAQEIKKLYNVDVTGVRIVNLPAKKVKFKRKPGVRSARRKAYIQLKEKQHIPGFELPKEKDSKKDKKAEETN